MTQTSLHNSIHFVLQSKGGVGKTFCASLQAQHLLDIGANLKGFDTDQENPDFAAYRGLAPFRSLISLMYRLIIYAVICGAFMEVSSVTQKMIQGLTGADLLSALVSGFELFKMLLGAAVAYGVLLMLLFRSDQIAANLASGSTSLNTSDLAAAAMTASVAAGMSAGMAGQAIQRTGSAANGLGDMVKGLLGQGKVGMRNASNLGELPGAIARPDRPGNMSVASESGNGKGGGGEASASQAAAPDPNEFRGFPNPLPQPTRDAARDAAREARRQARQQSTNHSQDAGAGIGGTTHAAPGQGLGGSFERLSRELDRGKSATHISMSAKGD